MSRPFNVQRACEGHAKDQAESARYIASYRARGGFEGALARRGASPLGRAYRGGAAATDHIPFPGHRHCGEWK